jgi:putative heme-binding domain-containing protein
MRGRDFDRGRNLFHATSCAKCHYFAGEGGAIGPDLSTAGRKFSLSDLMDAIIEPSKAISDQYGSHVVLTDDGHSFNGRVVELEDELHIYLQDPQAKPVVVKKENVDDKKISPISQMPVGLIDPLNEDELKDLIAYILSSGNKKARYFKP